MELVTAALLKGVRRGEERAIARLLTLIENRSIDRQKILTELFPYTGHAHVIGVTGSPGAGKSTLVDCLARSFSKSGLRVGIIAIDPSSPFSGGAILGDRIRMMRAEESRSVFIRSMATRGALGGISHATFEAVQVLDAAGFDIILVETVGVGQAEIDIVRTAHTVLVTLVPGMGDSVQSIKAGILEIADLFVINKADRDGADILHRDLRTLLSLVDHIEGEWEPQILRTVASDESGIDELVKAIRDHREWLRSSPRGEGRKKMLMEFAILTLAKNDIFARLQEKGEILARLSQDCLDRKIDPYSAAQKLIVSISVTSQQW